MTAIAKISTKGQITVPREVREALQVGPGDQIIWETFRDGTARIRRAQPPLDVEYMQALEETLAEEWNGPADEEAYRDL